MRLNYRNTFALLCLSLALTACPSKQKDAEVSNEPVEGSSSANNEKSSEGSSEEMQEKAKDTAEPAPATEPAAEEKK